MLLENKFVSYEFCDKCGSLIQITNKTTGKKYFNYNTENKEPVPISNTNIELEPYSVGIILYKK